MAVSQTILSAIALFLFNVHLVRCSPRALEERATCNADNVLRTFRASTNLADSLTFCSRYLSLPPVTTSTTISTSTVTADYTALTVVTIHPLYEYNLQHQDYDHPPTPISYNSASPSPSTVPGDPQFYGTTIRAKVRAPQSTALVHRRATTTPSSSLSTPTFIATTIPPSRISSACSCLAVPFSSTKTVSTATTTTTTATCLSYDKRPVATFPAFCGPYRQANAPSVVSSPPSVKTISPISVPDKLSCCAACAKVFNCVWWTFTFGTPNDGWKPGKCVYAYNIATGGGDGAPAICPNGYVSGLLGRTSFSGLEGANNLPGYNQGPCGDALNTFESSQDFGYPDDDPYGNKPQC